MAKLKAIWADPVWSKVIAAVIIAAFGLGVTHFFNLWPTISSGVSTALGFLRTATPVSNWLLGLFIICTLLVVLVIGSAIWQHIFPAQSVTWRSYTTDTFMGLIWHWQYASDRDIYNLYCCCLQCQYQVFPAPNGFYSIIFRCDSCGSVTGPFDEEMRSLESKVTRLIHQKLRTGSWASATAP